MDLTIYKKYTSIHYYLPALLADPTPKVPVVVEVQSSGKSSLLEGLMGLSVPVANGLCTVLVMQLRLPSAGKKKPR